MRKSKTVRISRSLKEKYYALVCLLFFLPAGAGAERKVLDNLCEQEITCTKNDIEVLVGNIRDIILNISIATAVFMVLVGAVLYITSSGNKEQAERGKKFILYSVIGLIIIIAAKFILTNFARMIGGDYS